MSRRTYLGKRRAEKLIELHEDLDDEDFLFSESKYVHIRYVMKYVF